MIQKSFFVLLFFFLITCKTWAYPDLSRLGSGYANCTACHYEPQGGQLPNEYGRSLVYEQFQADPSYLGLKKRELAPLDFSAGGSEANKKTIEIQPYTSLRVLQNFLSNLKTQTISKNQVFPMQMDAGLRAAFGPVALTSIAGYQKIDQLYVREFFLSITGAKISDFLKNQWLKVGVSLPSLGIKDFNHDLFTRKFLNLTFRDQYTGVEYSWIHKKLNLASGYWFRSNNPQVNPNTFFNSQVINFKLEYALNNRWVPGLSYFFEKFEQESLSGLSFHLRASLNSQIYLLGELDYFAKKTYGIDTLNLLAYLESGWDLIQGMNLWARFELLQNKETKTQLGVQHFRPSLGVKFYPGLDLELRSEVFYWPITQLNPKFGNQQSEFLGFRTQLHWFL